MRNTKLIIVILALLGIGVSGDDSVDYLTAVNSSTSAQAGVITVAAQTFLVTKAGGLQSPSTSLSSSITAAKTSVTESSTFIIKMAVTNTGSATATGVRPSSLDVNGTGWAALFKWPSPALVSIAPGKTAKFSMTYKAMLAGTVTLSGNATSTDGNSIVSSSPLITILPKKIGTAAVTDDLGNAKLKSGKVTLPIQIQDEDTGSPITGLSLALALDKKNHSRAVLAVADPLGRYPLQIIVLQGPNTVATSSSAICKAASQHQDTDPLTVSSRPDCSSDNLYSHVILPVETSALPSLKVNAPPSPLSDTISSATESALSSAMLEKLKATVSKTTISCQDALAEDKATLAELPVDKIIDKFIVDPAATAACAIAVPEFAAACPEIVESVGNAGDMLKAVNIMTDVFQCGLNPSDELVLQRVTLLPGTADVLLYQELVSPEKTTPTFVQVPVSAKDQYGQPLSTGSLEMFSQSNQGVGLRAIINNGEAEVPVPLGDYDWTMRSKNFKPQCGQVSVKDSNATIKAVMQPQPIASGTATADQLTGFLPEGTTFTVTPHFFDANGNEVACSGQVKFYAHNPVGTLVATVDADTGLVTMQGGCGAAGITAWCNGMESRRLLVSTDCDGKLPPTPHCVYSISPTAESFTASGGDGSATVATSDDTCAWTATSNADWITISSGNSGSGNGTVGYSVAANSGTAKRTGTLTIAGKTITVKQAGSGGGGGGISGTWVGTYSESPVYAFYQCSNIQSFTDTGTVTFVISQSAGLTPYDYRLSGTVSMYGRHALSVPCGHTPCETCVLVPYSTISVSILDQMSMWSPLTGLLIQTTNPPTVENASMGDSFIGTLSGNTITGTLNGNIGTFSVTKQ
jgi:hypothetical protein